MAVKFEYNLSATMADKILNSLRDEAYKKCEEQIKEANAYREGYAAGIIDAQDRLIRLSIIREEDAENENA